jgi:hypothetical protein
VNETLEQRSAERLEFERLKRGGNHGPLCRYCPHPKFAHPDNAKAAALYGIEPGECLACRSNNHHVFEPRGVEHL